MAARYERIPTLGGVYFVFAYDPELVARIKWLPTGARRWCPDSKRWFVKEGYVGAAQRCLDGDPNGATDFDPFEAADDFAGRNPPPAAPRAASPWRDLWLVEGAPLPVVKAAYRALAALHHPDAGGDEETMKRINLAHETLTRTLSGR